MRMVSPCSVWHTTRRVPEVECPMVTNRSWPAECAHRFPGHLPEFLPRPPDGARPFHRGAQLRFAPRDPHPDKIVVVAPRSSRAAAPRRLLDDELDSLQPAVPGFVVEVARADQALAVARDQLFRPRHSGRSVKRVSIRAPFRAERASGRAADGPPSGVELLEKNGSERQQRGEYEGGDGRAARDVRQGKNDADHDENPGRQGAAVFEVGEKPSGDPDALPLLGAGPLRRPFLEPDEEHVELPHDSAQPHRRAEEQGEEPQPQRRVISQPGGPEHDVDGAYRADEEEHENHGNHGPYSRYDVVAEDVVVLELEREVARVAQHPARAQLVEHVVRRRAQFALVEPHSAQPPPKDLHGGHPKTIRAPMQMSWDRGRANRTRAAPSSGPATSAAIM